VYSQRPSALSATPHGRRPTGMRPTTRWVRASITDTALACPFARMMDRLRRAALIGFVALAACGRDQGKAFADAAALTGGNAYAGVLTNTPQHMVSWIMDPPAIDSATAMPNAGVTEQDARDITAYLYTLTSGREPPR
jgi:cytochrome c1